MRASAFASASDHRVQKGAAVNRHLWIAAACVVAALGIGCDAPAGPGPLQRPDGGSGAGGSTLKVSPPVPVAPVNNLVAGSLTPILLVNNSRGSFTPGLDPALVFEVFDSQNSLVYRSAPVVQDPSNRTSHVVAAPLASGRSYSWHAIPVLDGRDGPPSARATFRTP